LDKSLLFLLVKKSVHIEVFSMENGMYIFDSMIMGDRVLSWGFYGNTQNSLSQGGPRRPSLPIVSVSPP
jgi:hypothetical protein